MAKLPSTNITISMVAQALGVSHTDLGRLCAGASSGGLGNIAYNVKENNPQSAVMGKKLDNATPYHNIYSKGPSYWRPELLSTSPDVYALRNYLVKNYSLPYVFSLGAFAGYDHAAIAPTVEQVAPLEFYRGSLPSLLTIPLLVKFGSLDWAASFNNDVISYASPHLDIYQIREGNFSQDLNISNPNQPPIPVQEGEYQFIVHMTTTGLSNNSIINLRASFRIGESVRFAPFFVLASLLKANIEIRLKTRPFISNTQVIFADGSEDQTQFILRNLSFSLSNNAGGWSGTPPYTNVYFHIHGEYNNTYAASVKVMWFLTTRHVTDVADLQSLPAGDSYSVGKILLNTMNAWDTFNFNPPAFNGLEDRSYHIVALVNHSVPI